jgi:hypothetical protein
MFIYVMDTESRDKLINLGYRLLRSDRDTVWVFENTDDYRFDFPDVQCVVSDTLTF